MNLWQLLPTILRTVGKLTGLGIATSTASALEQTPFSPEQQAALRVALVEHEQAMAAIDLERLKVLLSESLAEIQSTDRYTSRARPTGLYLAYICTAALVAGALAGVHLDASLILSLIAPCWGAAGFYGALRTKEKLADKA